MQDFPQFDMRNSMQFASKTPYRPYSVQRCASFRHRWNMERSNSAVRYCHPFRIWTVKYGGIDPQPPAGYVYCHKKFDERSCPHQFTGVFPYGHDEVQTTGYLNNHA